MPITLAVITSTFPEEERGKAIGVWTGVAGGGGILGMFLSALLVDVADWRRLFVLPVVLVVIALAMTLKSVPNSRERSAHSFDAIGALVSTIAVIGLVFVLQEGPERGWTAPITLISLAVGVIAAITFVAWELHRRDASLLDVRLFRERGLASGSITLLVVFGVQAGIAVVLFPFFQAVLGWSGLLSTVAMMPMAVMMMMTSGLAPKMAATIGTRSTMAVGVVLATLGLALMALFMSVDGGYLSILAGMLAMGIGMGLSMTPSTDAITSSLPRDKQGVASALNDVTREFGTALGVAVLGALLANGYRSTIDSKLDGIPTGVANTAREGIANAIEVAPRAGSHAQDLMHAAQQSFVDGWRQAMWIGAVVMAALLVHVALRGTKNTAPLQPESLQPDGEAAPETEAGTTSPPADLAGTPCGRSTTPRARTTAVGHTATSHCARRPHSAPSTCRRSTHAADEARSGRHWPPTGTGADPVVPRSSLGCRGDDAGMALSMRTAAMAAAVGKESLLRTRVRAEAPSMSSASCSPSCSGLVAPASRAVSVSRAAMAVL